MIYLIAWEKGSILFEQKSKSQTCICFMTPYFTLSVCTFYQKQIHQNDSFSGKSVGEFENICSFMFSRFLKLSADFFFKCIYTIFN